MALRITYSANIMTVQTGTVAEPKPDKFYSETAFYHALKKALNQCYSYSGERFDLVKRLMWKDGHMVDDHQYYLRDRKGRFCIYDPNYNVRLLTDEFNQTQCVALRIHQLQEDNTPTRITKEAKHG